MGEPTDAWSVLRRTWCDNLPDENQNTHTESVQLALIKHWNVRSLYLGVFEYLKVGFICANEKLEMQRNRCVAA